jgi:hypothetical protein
LLEKNSIIDTGPVQRNESPPVNSEVTSYDNKISSYNHRAFLVRQKWYIAIGLSALVGIGFISWLLVSNRSHQAVDIKNIQAKEKKVSEVPTLNEPVAKTKQDIVIETPVAQEPPTASTSITPEPPAAPPASMASTTDAAPDLKKNEPKVKKVGEVESNKGIGLVTVDFRMKSIASWGYAWVDGERYTGSIEQESSPTWRRRLPAGKHVIHLRDSNDKYRKIMVQIVDGKNIVVEVSNGQVRVR